MTGLLDLECHWNDRVRQQDREMDSLEPLLTVQELADYLGVPVATIYTWRYRGEGPIGFRVGKHVRYRWTDVEHWIRDRVRGAKARRTSDRTRTRASVGDRR